ncbi:hypothetical protein HN858_05435 [Candidatus Falkowbacteria bacterium]|jgi:hypothetical protein|nr:hypothetical protein [Candidatus Falkowbacteria bacterium]MBT5502972.1 hypothetical protein [Candidatus Falkowbacteria bacterium]MBT6574328.1 hypothetical protein [Candidatus Falkowbacteria bacterium]MBT7349079.1 hypothetical protein [Candidatus Falkowbacteria bacterium]MBT7500927.1 hypothetical protein [Candidatus Falkowbacteria bacterium]
MKKLTIFLAIFTLVFSLIGTANAGSVTEATKGKILIQVEENGEAWYVYPLDLKRYYLGRPIDAFNVMKTLGLGISETTYNNWNGFAPANLAGRIVLRVEANGEAYYINPSNNQLFFLGKPGDAWLLMKGMGLGITNANLAQIELSGDGASLDVDLGEVCPMDMKRYTNTTYKYTFCYNDKGEVKENADHTITFTRIKGEAHDGLGQDIDFYDSISAFRTGLMGNTSTWHAGNNAEGTYAEMITQDFDDMTAYHIVAQNQINKHLITLSYIKADSDDQFFMDGLWNTFEFTEPTANSLSEWAASITLDNCPTNSNLKHFKQDYQATEHYEFCYDPDWSLTLANGNKVVITPPVQNGKQIQGWFSVDLAYENVQSNYNSQKNESDHSNMTEQVTSNDNWSLEFDNIRWLSSVGDGVDMPSTKSAYHYLEIYDQDDDYYGRRAVFFFNGDIEGYDFTEFTDDILVTFKFFPTE